MLDHLGVGQREAGDKHGPDANAMQYQAGDGHAQLGWEEGPQEGGGADESEGQHYEDGPHEVDGLGDLFVVAEVAKGRGGQGIEQTVQHKHETWKRPEKGAWLKVKIL